jgi:hypothetical protein
MDATPIVHGVEISNEGLPEFDDCVAWVRAIGRRILPEKNCHLIAMLGRQATADFKEVRLIAYCGETYEKCGDGFCAFEITGHDPLSLREEDRFEALWRLAIENSRLDLASK